MAVIAKNKVILIIVGVLLLTNIAMLIFVLSDKPRERRVRFFNKEWQGTAAFLEKKVGFTQEQLNAYQQLRARHWEKMKPLLMDMRNAKDSFYRLLYRPEVTDSLLYRAADSIGHKQEAIDLQTFRHFQEVRRLCDPGQQQKFESLIHQVIHRMSVPFRRGSPSEKGIKDGHK